MQYIKDMDTTTKGRTMKLKLTKSGALHGSIKCQDCGLTARQATDAESARWGVTALPVLVQFNPRSGRILCEVCHNGGPVV